MIIFERVYVSFSMKIVVPEPDVGRIVKGRLIISETDKIEAKRLLPQ